MNDILQRIVAVKREEVAVARLRRDFASLRREAEALGGARDFVGALRQRVASGSAAVIAEIKKASPSKGVLRELFEPAAIAASYDQKAQAERQAQIRISDLNNMLRLLEDRDRIAHAKAAGRLAAGLPARERALIAGLVATVSYDYPRACESYGSLVRTDSSDVEALYGYGLCLLADDMVEPVVPELCWATR
jgi:hypothetical protein